MTEKILGVLSVVGIVLLASTCGGGSPTAPEAQPLSAAAQSQLPSSSHGQGKRQGQGQGQGQTLDGYTPCPTPGNPRKVVICHIPPGNPSNAHEICIGRRGVPAHLAHGDFLGECAACAPDDPYCCAPGDPYCCAPDDPYCCAPGDPYCRG